MAAAFGEPFQPPDELHRHELLGNELGRIQMIERKPVRFLLREELNRKFPLREMAGRDGLEHIALCLAQGPCQLVRTVVCPRGLERSLPSMHGIHPNGPYETIRPLLRLHEHWVYDPALDSGW